MRTTLNLDEQIVEQVMSLTGQSNRSEAVRLGLQAYIKSEQKRAILALQNSLELEDNWKAQRKLFEINQ